MTVIKNGYRNGNHLSWRQRSKQFTNLLRVIFMEFRDFLTWSAIAFTISTLLLYYIYPISEMPMHHHTLLGIAYDTVLMTFFESPLPFVDDWRLIPVFFGLPFLGLLVIAEGVIHLGNLLLQHKSYSKEWQKMLAGTYENHVIVCGLGNVGMRVAERLKHYEQEVVCIEAKSESLFIQEMENLRVPVIHGDARQTSTLLQAGLKKARSVIAATDNDLANIEIALNVREIRPDIKVVVRVFDQRLAEKIEKSFDISCAFSASALAAPIFAQAAISHNILSSFEFGGTTINAFQLIVDEDHGIVGMTIDAVRHKYEATVIMHERNQTLDWNPPPSTILQSKDKLLVVTDSSNVQTLLKAEAS